MYHNIHTSVYETMTEVVNETVCVQNEFENITVCVQNEFEKITVCVQNEFEKITVGISIYMYEAVYNQLVETCCLLVTINSS